MIAGCEVLVFRFYGQGCTGMEKSQSLSQNHGGIGRARIKVCVGRRYGHFQNTTILDMETRRRNSGEPHMRGFRMIGIFCFV